MQVRDLMMPSVLTASPNDTIAEVDRSMRDRGVDSVVVVENQSCIGLLTDKEMAMAENDGRVRDFMKPCHAAEPGASLEDAAQTMARERCRPMPVVEAGMLIGIISMNDIKNWAANASDDESQRIITLSLDGYESSRPRT
jgi:CBS domain-containing protein